MPFMRDMRKMVYNNRLSFMRFREPQPKRDYIFKTSKENETNK